MLLFAVTAGAMVANLYYLQPLLAAVAAAFGREVTDAGYLVTFTQAGYGIGVLLIVPIGDVLDRRRLLSIMMAANAAALLAAAASPTFAMFCASSLLIGITACATMMVIPYVASIAPARTRGKSIAQAMTGLLLGILLARTVSGLIAQAAGWRVVFVSAAAAVAVLAVLLRRAMKTDPPRGRLRYRQLIASLAAVVRAHPELGRRALYGMLALASFSMLWTGLTFLLSAPPFGYSEAQIGLFGLVGALGAVSANAAGRLADRGHARLATTALAIVLLASWGLLALGAHSLAAVIGGVFLLDVGVQGLQVTHQSVIYSIAPEARSRVTAVFITSCFAGASLGSALASALYAAYGWAGLCVAGGLFPALLLAVFLAFTPRARKA
ncbi:MFS transporter [Pigmentiphaga soli]|uniref:MFS transporter n=2 Tax=Pigmentiphaga soli TaxID=1007095 RepID=A0ABP8GZF7_9BURK